VWLLFEKGKDRGKGDEDFVQLGRIWEGEGSEGKLTLIKNPPRFNRTVDRVAVMGRGNSCPTLWYSME
jgi:hypothetical protein